MLDTCARAYLTYKTRPHFQRYWHSRRIAELYQRNREMIAEAIGSTEFYHGTGNRHYGYDQQQKAYSHTKQTHSLFSLLAHGILPAEDLYSERFMIDKKPTTSLTQKRMYARVYADLHETADDPCLKFRYGSSAFWWRYFLMCMLLDGTRDPQAIKNKSQQALTALGLSAPQPATPMNRRVGEWMSSFRHDPELQALLDLRGSTRNRIRAGLAADQLMAYGKSTIPENFPLIIGIKKDNVIPAVSRSRGMRMFETRTNHPIAPTNWSYLEVPGVYVRSVKTLTQQMFGNHHCLPVLAMEQVELYCALEADWQTLTTPHANYQLCPPSL